MFLKTSNYTFGKEFQKFKIIEKKILLKTNNLSKLKNNLSKSTII